MKASTVRIDKELLAELSKRLPKSLSLRKYVVGLIQRDLHERKMAEASERYRTLLQADEAEASWLEVWERAPLEEPADRSAQRRFEEEW